MSDIANVERAVLGSMMQSTNAAHDVIDVLVGLDFESPRHELVFDAIAALVEEGKPHDALAVADRLNQTPGDLNRVGGHSFLHELVMCVATSASAGYHADIIREAALKRRLRVVGARLEQLSHGDGPALDMLNTARTELDAAVEERDEELATPDAVDAALASLDQPPGVPTPWPSLTRIIAGWQPQRLYVGAARPGVGKSVFGVSAVLDMAHRGGRPVMFSLEMSRDELWLRMLSNVGQVDGQRIQTRTLRPEDRAKLEKAATHLRGLPITIDARSNLSLAQIRAKVRSLKRRGPVDLVVVDYLALIAPPKGSARSDRQVQVDAIARGLKILASDEDVPLLALAQLNRESEHRSGGSLKLTDLRESGGVENHADIVMLMQRAVDVEDGDPSELGIYLGKNRSGPMTRLTLTFQGHYSRLTEPPAWGQQVPA